MNNLKILGAIVLVTVLGVAGWFLVTKQSQNNADLMQNDTEVKNESQEQEEKQGDSQKSNVESQKSVEETVEDINTSNWKTYRNEEFGFEMKLPGDLKKWNVKVEYVNKEYSKFNSNKHYIIWFNYPLDQKILRSKGQPGMGYIKDMNIWYIEAVNSNDYKDNACEIKQIPKCRQGKILGKNNKYVFVSGFPNLWTPCMPDDKESKNQKEFCEVDHVISSDNIKNNIDFTILN